MNMQKTLNILLVTALLCGLSLKSLADEAIPKDLVNVGIDDKTGSAVDLSLTFRNEKSEIVPLSTYFQKDKPVLLFPIYYGCPSLCNFVLNAAVETLQKLEWRVGTKFQVVAVSIDPRESASMATAKRDSYVEEYNKNQKITSTEGWHFLTGTQDQIEKLTQQIGFRYKWVEETKQYAHGAGFFVMTPEGKVSRTIYGVVYSEKDLKMALLEASQGKIGTILDRIMLFCYHYDINTKKYVPLANRIMQIGGLGTLVALSFFISIMVIRDRRSKLLRGSS